MMMMTMKVVGKSFHHHQANMICMETKSDLLILTDSTYNLTTYLSYQPCMRASEMKLQKNPATHNFLTRIVTRK